MSIRCCVSSEFIPKRAPQRASAVLFCAVAAALSSAAVLRCTRVAAAYSPQPGGSPFLGRRSPVHTSCVSNTPFPGGGFRRLRAAGTFSKRIDTPYGGFYPLGTPSSALLGYLGATERKRSYLEVGPKKGTAVPLPAHRPQSAIPFTATLKPFTVCGSIYAKSVKSAAITPQQRGKRKPIPFLYASYLRSRAVRPVRVVAEGKVGVQRGRETVGVPPFLRPPRERPVPALRRARNPQPGNGVLLTQLGCTM